MAFSKEARRAKIRKKIRARVNGTENKPRLSVFRSNKQIYAQVIDDVKGVTLASASSLKMSEAAGTNKIEQAKLVGKSLAERAKAAGVEGVVFDRGGYLFHGRVKSLAESAREAGLKF
ncbi:MAG: 50S ribosomal protein L18 [Flavobacteriales bacterium]|nr:50S ribosomal protein L18 [Flavobacteriales bacterium]